MNIPQGQEQSTNGGAIADALGHALSSAITAIETRSLSHFEQEVAPLLAHAGRLASSQVELHSVIASIQPFVERAVSGEEMPGYQDAALLVTSAVTSQLDRSTARELIKPYAADIAHTAADRFPKLRMGITLLRWFGPKDINWKPPPDTWRKASDKALRELRMVVGQLHEYACRLGRSPMDGLRRSITSVDCVLRCDLPVVTLLGDAGTGKTAFTSFLLHPLLGQHRNLLRPRGGSAANSGSPLLSGTQRGMSSFASTSAGSFVPSASAADRSVLDASGKVPNSFVVYMFSETPCEWSGDALAALANGPFGFVRELALDRFARTTVRAIGLPHALLRNTILVCTPGLGRSCRHTTAPVLRLVDAFVEASDRVLVFFDCETPAPSVELHATLTSHSETLRNKMKFIWNTHRNAAPRAMTQSPMAAFGALNFNLARIVRGSMPLQFHVIGPHAPSSEDMALLVMDLTENLHHDAVDGKIARVTDLLHLFRCHMKAIEICGEEMGCREARAGDGCSRVQRSAASFDVSERMKVMLRISDELGIRADAVPIVEWLELPSVVQQLAGDSKNVQLAEKAFAFAQKSRTDVQSLHGLITRASDPLGERLTGSVRQLLEVLGVNEDAPTAGSAPTSASVTPVVSRANSEIAIGAPPPQIRHSHTRSCNLAANALTVQERTQQPTALSPARRPLASVRRFSSGGDSSGGEALAMMEQEEVRRAQISGDAWEMFSQLHEDMHRIVSGGSRRKGHIRTRTL